MTPNEVISTEPCQRCGEPGERRAQLTAYVDDALNYATLCDACQEEADEYWKDMWADYYSAVR